MSETLIRTTLGKDVLIVGADMVIEVDAGEQVTGKTFHLTMSTGQFGQTLFTKDDPVLFEIDGTERGIRFQLDRADTLDVSPQRVYVSVYEPSNPANPVAVIEAPLTWVPGVSEQ